MTWIPCSAASSTSLSKPPKSGSKENGPSGWIAAQVSASLTLRTPLLRISS